MIEVETFQPGNHVRSGNNSCFVPSLINDEWTWRSPEISRLLEAASNRLGELKGLSRLAPNVDLFVTLLTAEEATASSRIEGTQTVLDETVRPEAQIKPERRDDWREVRNYIDALAEARQSSVPLSSRTIKQAHKILMRGARGQNKAPGEFRRVQNYLSASPVSPKFYPPPAPKVAELMSDLEKFLHNDDIHTPILMRIAIAHYQFETIHPFLDGNGRIGRLMIPLYLTEKKQTDKPLLYMSRYLEQNKMQYYQNLTLVRDGDMARWLKYFLTGARDAAADAVRTLNATLSLKDQLSQTIDNEFKRSGGNARTLLEHLFKHQVVTVEEVAQKCGITYKTANTLVEKFVQLKLLREITGRTRNRLFVFQQYLDIFTDR